MRRLNVKLLVALLVAGVVFVGGAYFARRHNVSRNMESLKRQAENSLNDQDYSTAVKRLDRYLRYRTDNVDGWNRMTEAVNQWIESEEVPSEGWAMAVQTGLGVFTRAKGVLLKISEDEGNEESRELAQKVIRELAELQLSVGLFSQAAENFEVLLAAPDAKTQFEDYGDLRYQQAQALYRHGKSDEALEILESLTGFNANSQQFDEAAAEAPELVSAYSLLAEVMQSLDRDEDAEAAIEQVVRVSPDSPDAYILRGRYARIKAARTLKSQKSEREQFLAKAESDLRHAVELDPESIDAKMQLVDVLLEKGESGYDEAERVLREVQKQAEPNDVRSFYRLALLAQARGSVAQTPEERTAMQEAGLAAIEEGLDRAPNNAALLDKKVEALVYLNRPAEARKAWERFKSPEVGASPEQIQVAQAQVLIAEKEWLQAQRLLENVSGSFTGMEELQLDVYRALCAENLGELDKAQRLWESILARQPDNAQANLAIVRIGTQRRDPNILDQLEGAYEAISEELADQEGASQVWAVALDSVKRSMLQQFINQQMQLPEEQRDWTQVKKTAAEIYKGMGPLEQLILRADIADILGQEEQAKIALDEALKKFPDEPVVYRAVALSALRDNDPATAAEAAQRGIARLGVSESLLSAKLGAVARMEGDDAAVQERIREILAQAESLDAAAARAIRFSAGLALIQRDAKEEGLELWNQVAESDPNDFGSRLALFMIAEQDRDVAAMDEVIEELKGNPRFGPQSAEYYLLEAAKRTAQILNALTAGEEIPANLLSEARDFIRRGKQSRPDWDRLERIDAQLELLAGDADAAIRRLKHTVQLNPADLISARQLFQMQVAQQDLDGAMLTIESLGPGPHPRKIGRLLAGVLELKGQVDRAVREGQRVIDAPDAEASDYMWFGAMLNRNERIAEAEQALRAAIELDPTAPGPYLVLISYYMQKQETGKATTLASEAVTKLPEKEKLLFTAQALETLGRTDVAGTKYREAAEQNPDSMNALGAYANYLYRNDRKEELKPLVDQLIAAGPESAGGHFSWARRVKAQELADTGVYRDFTQAVELLESEPKSSPEEAVKDGLMLAQMYVRRQSEPSSWKRGLELFESIQEKRRLSNQERQLYAELLRRVKDNAAARQLYGQILGGLDESSPQYQQYLAQLVNLLIEMGDYSQAEARIRRLQGMPAVYAQMWLDVKRGRTAQIRAGIEKIKPQLKDAQQIAALGLFMERLGLVDEADDLLKEFVQQKPEAAPAYADFLGRQGRLDEALRIIDQLTKQHGPHPQLAQTGYDVLSKNRGTLTESDVKLVEGWVETLMARTPDTRPEYRTYKLQLAQLRELRDQQDDVIRLYQDLLEYPDIGEFDRAIILNNLAFNYSLKTRDGAKAIEMVNQAMEILGPRSTLLDTRGVAHLVSGDVQAAVKDLREAVYGSEDPQFFLHLAWALDKAGESDEALSAFQQAQELRLNANGLTSDERKAYESLKSKYGTPDAAALPARTDRPAA